MRDGESSKVTVGRWDTRTRGTPSAPRLERRPSSSWTRRQRCQTGMRQPLAIAALLRCCLHAPLSATICRHLLTAVSWCDVLLKTGAPSFINVCNACDASASGWGRSRGRPCGSCSATIHYPNPRPDPGTISHLCAPANHKSTLLLNQEACSR